MGDLTGIKLVVFDFDQTIVDSARGFNVAISEIIARMQTILKRHGISVNVSQYSEQLRRRMRQLDANQVYNRDRWWDILVEDVLEITNFYFEKEERTQLTNLYWDITIKNTELYPDTLEIIRYLKNKKYKIGLLTDTDGVIGIKKRRIVESSIRHFFDGILIAGDDTAEMKPHPEPFLKLAARLGCTPQSAVMVGDKPFTDIKGGKAAGFTTVLILRENWEMESQPDYIIHSLSDLKTIL
ncbi:MAG: HAD family hydrolase [Candidatus Helarchaeota archaeon]